MNLNRDTTIGAPASGLAGGCVRRDAEHSTRDACAPQTAIAVPFLHPDSAHEPGFIAADKNVCATLAFTLIELVLALAISAVVLVAITTLFFGALRLRDRVSDVATENLP
ncbi:MAG TPA: prepilin-type N-terminal cleavage/methylation domain-containing protein, partial [Verrucomicrobiae bacterium]|nr:prepilin-type N-terminal cleavage/methylation domain-containing protein [Verrucomicrobiae bacterium]